MPYTENVALLPPTERVKYAPTMPMPLVLAAVTWRSRNATTRQAAPTRAKATQTVRTRVGITQ